MFLAAIYPLSEKSALNLPGKVNTSNVTYCEDAATYLCNNNQTTSGVEGVTMEVEVEGNSQEEEKNSADAAAPEIAYDMYQSFWKLQV